MRTIAAYFIRAKHWQLFLLFTCMQFVGPVIAITARATVATDFIAGGVWVFGMLCFMGWLWAMGVFSNSLTGPATRMKTIFFRFALIYPLLYMVAVGVIFFKFNSSIGFSLVLPPHLLAMFCMFYDLYFVSKNLTMAETGRAVTFNDFAGPFFLIWFFPLGIWFIQPRLNRLYEHAKDAETPLESGTSQ